MSIAIIGGGWSGLAAAVTLADRGVPVTLFESAPHFGGRARRVTLHGLPLDNGQHLLLGAYHATLKLLAQVGVDPESACEGPPLTLLVKPWFVLRAGALPAPWHLGWGLLRSRGLSLREKWLAIRMLQALQRQRFHLPTDHSVDELLTRYRQTENLRRYLWMPLCVAALNTPAAEASAQIFVNVLRDAFFGARDDSRMLLPKRDIGSLFPDAAVDFLTARGATLRAHQRILRIERQDSRFRLFHAAGSEIFDRVICAVPPFRVGALLANIPALDDVSAALSAWRHQPIYTVYLQFDAALRLPFPMLGLSQGLSQWVFDRSLTGQAGLLAVVISASGEHEHLPHAALARRVRTELADALGIDDEPRWVRVIAEKRATFACTPGLHRPPNRTAVPGFYLAGDYTDSDYPATLESAVRSGVASAGCALRDGA